MADLQRGRKVDPRKARTTPVGGGVLRGQRQLQSYEKAIGQHLKNAAGIPAQIDQGARDAFEGGAKSLRDLGHSIFGNKGSAKAKPRKRVGRGRGAVRKRGAQQDRYTRARSRTSMKRTKATNIRAANKRASGPNARTRKVGKVAKKVAARNPNLSKKQTRARARRIIKRRSNRR